MVRLRDPLGIFLAILSGLCFGAAVAFVGYSYTEGANALGYIFISRAIAALCLCLLVRQQGKSLRPRRVSYKFLGLICFNFSFFSLLHFSAMQFMPVQLVTVLVFLYPLILSVMALILDKAKMSNLLIASLALAFGGLYLVLGPEWAHLDYAGVILALAAAFLIALHLYMCGRALKGEDADSFSAMLMTGAFFATALFMTVVDWRLPVSFYGWWIVTFASLLSIAGQICFSRAVQRIGPVPVSIYIKIEPLVTLILAALLLGESLTAVQWLGAGLVIAGIIINSFDKEAPPPKIAVPE